MWILEFDVGYSPKFYYYYYYYSFVGEELVDGSLNS